MTSRKPWGQSAGNGPVIHSTAARGALVASESRNGPQGSAQGSSLAKPLWAEEKMPFSTGAGPLYY